MVLTIPFRACSCGYPAQLIGDFTNDAVGTFYVQNCSLLEGLAGCGNNITASDVGTSAIVNAILGLLSFLGFGILRVRSSHELELVPIKACLQIPCAYCL